MTEPYSEDLALALELADVADRITMAHYRSADLVVETKPDMTPVSEADRAVELALRERLAAVRAGDAIIGEEFGDAAPRPEGLERGRLWVLDPIDGTKSYVRGMDTWTTLIALVVDGEVKVGVVSMPALARRWWATRGGGAFADGRPIRVSAVEQLADAQLLWSGVHEWDAVGALEQLIALARRCWRQRGIGDAWQYMLVAEGAAEIATDPEVMLWDLAAPSIVVQEAGGRFTDLAGVDGPGVAIGRGVGSAVATNARLHEAVLAALR